MFGEFVRKGLYFNQADGAGSSPAAETTTDNGNGTDLSAQADPSVETGKKEGEKVQFTPEQQKAVDEIVKERLARHKKTAETEAQKAKAKAEEDALAQNKEFETLATQRATRITELETQIQELTSYKDLAEKYRSSLESIVKDQVAKLPMSVQTLVQRLDPNEQIDYLAKHAKEFNVNFNVVPVPETEPESSKSALTKEVTDKVRRENERTIKSFFH